MKIRLLLLAAVLLALHFPTAAQIANAGPYVLQQTVIARGGGEAADGNYGVENTIGQAAAGTTSSGDVYSVAGGFWTRAPLGPAAANASISGRGGGRRSDGINRVTVTLFAGTQTSPRVAITNQFGYFTIHDVPVGHFYFLSMQHRRYTFAPDIYPFHSS